MADETQSKQRAAHLFDIRRIIGGLFIVYGVTLTITGALASDADIHKAAGVNINLWTGLGMIVFGGLFILWLVLRPIELEEQEPQAEEPHSEEARRRSRFDSERAGGRVGAGREET
jgi:quinol-cytochrome oxidoreductase complex cytochrome b subunit